MLACPQRGRKHTSKPLWVTPRCVLLLTWSSLVGLMTSRQSLTCYAHTGNIRRPSPLKMALSYMEKPSSFLHQKGRGCYSNSSSSIRNHQSPVVGTWMCLLARHKQGYRRSSLAVWDLHPVPSPKCCNTHHSNANSVPPMADVHHRHLYLRRNQLPDIWWLLFKDDPCLISSIWPEQHCQSCLTAQRDVLRV